jgi:S1-C subfamily serine protease
MEHLIKKTHSLIYIVIIVNIALILSIFILHFIQIGDLSRELSGVKSSLSNDMETLSSSTENKLNDLGENVSNSLSESMARLDTMNQNLLILAGEIERVEEEGNFQLESIKSGLNYTGVISEAMDSVVIIENNGNTVGAGVIVSAGGYVVTAAHVVKGKSSLKVKTYEGEKFTPQKLRTNGGKDITILKITSGEEFPFMEIGNVSLLGPGDKVFALGSPEGLSFSASEGIVSALREFSELGINDDIFDDDLLLIQTDAAITHGNSGGPLINKRGELVGINSFSLGYNAGSSIFLDSEGVNFAISASEVLEIYNDVRN